MTELYTFLSEISLIRFIIFWLGIIGGFYGCLNFILQIIHKSIRAKTIRKVGYPPEYCDGDGDVNKYVGTSDDKGINPLT